MRNSPSYAQSFISLGVLLLLSPLLHNCSKNTTVGGTTAGVVTTGGTTGANSAGTTGSTTGLVTKSASVSGSVSSSVVNTGSAKFGRWMTLVSDACAQAKFSVFAVGGGNTPVATGTADANGTFTIAWSVNVDPNASVPEVILHFDCATALSANLRCFGKPGDTGLICDPVANALANSLESSLGKPLESDNDLRGLSVAKIVEGLAETLKLVSQLNPSNDLVAQLAAASDPNQAAAIIAGSPVGSMFTSIATIARQTIAQNQTAQDVNSQTSALQGVWPPGRVIELMASLGLTVELPVDNQGDGGPDLYSPVFDAIDIGTNTHFSVEVKKYLSDLYQSLYVDSALSDVSLLCRAQRFNNSGYVPPAYYPPDAQDANGIHQLTCLGETAVLLGLATPSTDPNQTGNNPNNAQVNLEISSAYQEADRNDPTGTHGEFSGRIDLSISLVDIFPEFEAALEPNGVCSSYVTQGPNGPGPNSNWPGLGACVRDNGLGNYFAGVLGVYRFLTDTSLANIQLSLTDLYVALVDGAHVRFSVQLPYFFNGGFNVDVTDAPQGPQNTYLPLLLADSNTTRNNQPLYQTDCPSWLCVNGQLPQGGGEVPATMAQLSGLLAETRPSFASTYGEFENIPDFATLQHKIFASAHHIEYNPSGSATWTVQGVDPSPSGQLHATQPILCAFIDSTDAVVNHFGPGIHVNCVVAQGTWEGGLQLTGPDYTNYFGLAAREGQGGKRYYAMVDTYTGMDYDFNGQTFRIWDVSNDPNATGADGTTLYTTQDVYCSAVQTNSGTSTSCWYNVFGYVKLNFPNINVNNSLTPAQSFYPVSFYQPYSESWPLTMTDPNGYQRTGQIQVAVSTGSTDPNISNSQASYAVCLDSNAVTVDPNHPLVATAINANGHTFNCANALPSTAYYFVTLAFIPGGPTTPSAYNYFITRNDGSFMHRAACTPSPQDECQLLLPLTTLQSALGNQILGPTTLTPFMATFQLLNPSYDAKFDPYCADPNGEGHCDCYRVINPAQPAVHLTGSSTPSSADCTLDDSVGHQATFPQAPVMQGPQANIFWRINAQAGNQSGVTLANTLHQLAQQDPNLSIFKANANWNQVFVCQNGNALQNVDLSAVQDPNGAGHAGQGCGNPNVNAGGPGPGGGPVTMIRFVPRNNAYDIARPQTLLKLLSTATQNTGTGVSLAANQPAFNFTQALAMEFVRLVLPFHNLQVQVGNYAGGSGSTFVAAPPGTQVSPTQIWLPNSHSSSLTGATLRAFLRQGHIISN